MLYCLFGYINNNVCLKWVHTNCACSGLRSAFALKPTQKQQKLREVLYLVNSVALAFHSNIIGTREPVNLPFSHNGKQ